MRARRGNEVRREFLGNDGNKSNVTPSERGRRRRLSSRGPAAHGDITCPVRGGVPPGASGRASDPEELVFMRRADNMSQAIGGQMADAVER